MIETPHLSHRKLWTAASLMLLVIAFTHIPASAQGRPFPYSLSRRDAVLLPAGLGLAALGLHLQSTKDLPTPDDVAGLVPTDVNGFDRTATRRWSPAWSDRSSTARDIVLGSTFVLVGAEGVRALAGKRSADGATLGVMFAELGTFLVGSTYVTKATVGRKRPYAYNPDLAVGDKLSDGEELFLSFYSGHAASAFAAATFTSTLVTDIYGRSIGTDVLWGSTLVLAAFTSYARVMAGKHYPTDVIAGALVGGAIGHLVPRLHRQDAGDRMELSVTPASVALQVRF